MDPEKENIADIPEEELNPAQVYQDALANESAQLDDEEDALLEKGFGASGIRDRMAGRGKSASLRQRRQDLDNEETAALQDRVGDLYNQAKEADDSSNNKTGIKHRLSSKSMVAKRLRYAVGGGIFSMIFALLIGGFSLIGNFKLEHFFQNLDRVSYAKFNSAFERRSDKWFQAYIKIRLSEYVGDVDGRSPLYFRANKVDTNNPLRDWYQTLRTSSFEADLAKQGISFQSSYDYGSGRVRAHVVTFNIKENGTPVNKTIDMSDLSAKDVRGGAIQATLNEFDQAINTKLTETFDNDRNARRAIKRVVEDNTKSWQWYKRRTLRKNIQNMTGVRSWRFFETTRDKVDTKKNNVKAKLVRAIVPETTKSGKFMQCLFGVGQCSSSSDPGNPSNQGPDTPLNGRASNETDDSTNYDENGNKKPDSDTTRGSSGNAASEAAEAATKEVVEEAAEEAVDEASEDVVKAGIRGKFIRKIIDKFSAVLSVTSILDQISKIHRNITGGSLVKMVIAAKSAQVIANYATYHTISDQAKEGDLARNLFNFASDNPDEFNEVMKGLNGMEQSEMYASFFPSNTITAFSGSAYAQGGSAEGGKKLSRAEYCADDHTPNNSDFHWLCPETTVGGQSNAGKFTEIYNSTAGKVIGPVVTAYQELLDVPGVNWLKNLVNSITDKIGAIIQPLVEKLLSGLGLDGKINDMLGWLMSKILIIAGGGPMSDGGEPAGYKVNLIGQGAVAAAGATERQSGAMAATATTQTYLKKLIAEHHEDKLADMSLKDRFLSLDNTESILHRSLFAVNVSKPRESIMTALNPILVASNAISGSVGMAFGGSSFAATAITHNPARTSGQDVYDIPPECIDSDPIESFTTPSSGTNAELILGENLNLSWEDVTDQRKFYEKVYQSNRIKDLDNRDPKGVDSLAGQIYNCHLFDQDVRQGQRKGYQPTTDEDDILGASQSVSAGNNTPGTSVKGQDTSNMSCAVGATLKPANERVVPIGDGTVKVKLCDYGGVIGVNASWSPNMVKVLELATSQGVSLSGGGFRTAESQISLRRKHCGSSSYAIYQMPSNQCTPHTARPGTSNHEQGLAIDFKNCSSRSTACYQWLLKNGSPNGVINYPKEPWHWSFNGS